MNKLLVLNKNYIAVDNLPLLYNYEMPKAMAKALLQGYESIKLLTKLPLYSCESS